MTRDEATVRIQDGLGFRTDLSAKIGARIQEAQRDLERGKTLPLFLLVENYPTTLAAMAEFAPLPTDFLRRSSRPWFWQTGAERPTFLEWADMDDLFVAYDRLSTNNTYAAFLMKTQIRFYPPMNQERLFRYNYYKRATPLTSGSSTNEWLDDTYVPELLIGEAGLRMARDLRDAAAATIFMEMRDRARDSLFRDTIVQEADTLVFMGGDK